MEVRVRYAPSPTGMQHIGGVRTALFNYLFARANGGKFILRLEDTDRTRYGEEYVQNLFDTLSWLGIEWDEGGEKGGPYGPYIQSQRFDIYKKYAQDLVEKGQAYLCFCDEKRLEEIRIEQTKNKANLGYDRHCRSLDTAEIEANLKAGKPYVIRLKVPSGGVTKFHDALLGDIEWKNDDISPDPVLIKSDGFPTYHLANVIDDHLMKVTHVMRAQEWIPSTPLHVIMYQSFGWDHPSFCHLPMVNGQDGQKLSKRHGATSMNEFRARGYVPSALINYVAMLGCSYEEGRDLFSLADFESLFKMEKLNKAAAIFDYKKLEWFNGQYIRLMSDDELYSAILPFITGTGDAALPVNVSEEFPAPKVGPVYSGVKFDENGLLCAEGLNNDQVKEKLYSLLPLIRERLHYLTDAAQMVNFLFKEPDIPAADQIIPKKLDAAKTVEILTSCADYVRKAPSLSHEDAEQLARSSAESLGVKLGDFMMPLRMALTGSKVSPPLVGVVCILGSEKSAERVQKTIDFLSK